MRRTLLMGFAIGCAVLASRVESAGEKQTAGPLIVLDAKGKEVKVTGWSFVAGVRRLPGKDGPAYLEFREDKSTTYQAGILTLVPITALRRIDYDYDKKAVTVVVAVADGKDATLTGTTRYQGINRLTIAGDADLGDLGSASVKFRGGDPKGGMTGARFPAPRPVPPPVPAVRGANVVIVATDKEKTRHAVADLAALYVQPDGTYRLAPQLMFKKTVKIDLARIESLRHVPPENKKALSDDFEVTLRDGEKLTLTLLTKVDADGGKSATLAGLIGRVAVGYKLFPPHTIAELRTEGPK